MSTHNAHSSAGIPSALIGAGLGLFSFVAQYEFKQIPSLLLLALGAVAVLLFGFGVLHFVLQRIGRAPTRWWPLRWVGFGTYPLDAAYGRAAQNRALRMSLQKEIQAVWTRKGMTAPELRIWAARIAGIFDSFNYSAASAKFQVNLTDDAEQEVVDRRLEGLRTELTRMLIWDEYF